MSERNITYLTNACLITCIVEMGSAEKVLEAAKDHCKTELKKSKERLETLKYPQYDEGAEAVIQEYMKKGT